HCTAFTLLQLYNSCSQFRAELEQHPSIVLHSYGFIRRPKSQGTTQEKSSTNPSEAPPWQPPISIHNIDAVACEKEEELFKKLHMLGDDLRGRRVVCEDCWSVGKCVGYRGGENSGKWLPDWCTCIMYKLCRAQLPPLDELRDHGRLMRSETGF